MKKLLFILLLLPCLALGRGRAYLAYDDSFDSTTIKSNAMIMNGYQHAGIHLIYTGSAIDASCAMEASNDNVNWEEVTGSLVTLTAAGGSDYIDRSGLSAMWMRATCTSNDANAVDMDIYLSGK